MACELTEGFLDDAPVQLIPIDCFFSVS